MRRRFGIWGPTSAIERAGFAVLLGWSVASQMSEIYIRDKTAHRDCPIYGKIGIQKGRRIMHDKCEPFSAISVSNIAHQCGIYRQSSDRNLSSITKRSVLHHADLSEKGESMDYQTSGRKSWHSECLERPRTTISRYR